MKIENESVPPIIQGYAEQLLSEFTHPSTRSNTYAVIKNVHTYLSQVLAEYQMRDAKGDFSFKKGKR